MKLIAPLLQFSRSFSMKTRSFSEIKIPVPWGHIAGKWWGPGKTRPVVSLHGWQDNSGTWDALIPLLPEHVEFLAIDMPGHGLSSHIPDGVYYYHPDTIIMLRRLQKYFDWSQMSLMGHSLGAMSNFMFASTFPKDVDMFICVDGFRPAITKNVLEKRSVNIDNFLKYDRLRKLEGKLRPSYPMDVMEKMWHEGSRKSIDLDKCHYILKRNTAVAPDDPNKYYLTLDPRLKVGSLLNYPQDEMLEGAKRLTMPAMLIRASEKIYFQDWKPHQEVIDLLKTINPKFEEYVVQGTHHLQLNNPERVQGIISDFLNKYYQSEQIDCAAKQAKL